MSAEAAIPSSNPHSPPRLTPLIFQKVKNHLLNGYSATEPGRFTYYLSQDQEHFWKLISEKYPIPAGLSMTALQKANVVWERLEQEPSPRRFVELCQAVVDHIYFIQHLPATERKAPMYFADSMHEAYIREVWGAFSEHGRENLLLIEKSEYDPGLDRCIAYAGNDFSIRESEYFVSNMFESTTVNTVMALQSQKGIKKRWGLSKLSPKLKFPGFEIGAEVEKK